MKNVILIAVVVLIGIVFQSCKKIENPILDTKYVTLRPGFHGNNTYKIPEGGIRYTSDEAIGIYFVANYEEEFKPEFSMGKNDSMNTVVHNIGDTIIIATKNSSTLIRVTGRIQVL